MKLKLHLWIFLFECRHDLRQNPGGIQTSAADGYDPADIFFLRKIILDSIHQ